MLILTALHERPSRSIRCRLICALHALINLGQDHTSCSGSHACLLSFCPVESTVEAPTIDAVRAVSANLRYKPIDVYPRTTPRRRPEQRMCLGTRTRSVSGRAKNILAQVTSETSRPTTPCCHAESMLVLFPPSSSSGTGTPRLDHPSRNTWPTPI